MRAFTRRLVERLRGAGCAEGEPGPLSRNRHFHTFETAEGRRALRIARRLRSLERDLVAQAAAGLRPRVTRVPDGEGVVSVEVEYRNLHGRRTAYLTAEEFEMLLANVAVRAILQGSGEQRGSRSRFVRVSSG